jgi:long-subunit fatty acid transport protein
VNYTVNEENDRDYSFGDEFNIATGISHNIGTRFSYSAVIRYRTTKADQRGEFAIPNTGGKWVDFVPAVSFTIIDSLSLSVFGRLPLARDLNGVLQFTTSYSYGVALSYGF